MVTGITDAGCSNTAVGTQTIVINPMPIVFAGNDFINCENDPITLSATGAANYVWDNSVVQNVAFTPTSTLTYTVSGTDGNGCIGTDTITVTFEPTPNPSFVADSTAGCEPMDVLFMNTTIGNFVDCQWTFGDGNTGVGCTDILNTYQSGGTYDVTLLVTSAEGCSNSVTYTDYIYVENNPSASFIPSLHTVLSLDTEVSFTNTTTGGVNYVWDFGDDTDLSTSMNPSHEFPGDQTSGYIVTLYAYSPIGCIDSTTSIIQVNEEVIYYIPNTFTPDGDEFNQLFQPIFTAGYDPYDFNMQIFNRWGEVIYETNDDTVGWDGTYNGKTVQDGIYTWKIEFKTISSDERIMINGHVLKTK
ncbi:MAG: gliding motility-associated-like protein [Crocinitomicaceae bacterium]